MKKLSKTLFFISFFMVISVILNGPGYANEPSMIFKNQDLIVTPGSILEFPLVLSSYENILSWDLEVSFDPNKITFSYQENDLAIKTGVSKDYCELFLWNLESERMLRAGATTKSTNDLPLGIDQEISLINLKYQIKDNIPAGTTAILVNLTFFNPDESSHNISTQINLKIDADGDGLVGSDDCDETNPDINKNASEVCDGKDNDCDGQIDEGLLTTFYRDADGDGFGVDDLAIEACSKPAGYVVDSGDCNDDNPDVNPDAYEVLDGIDNNCDGLIDNISGLPTWTPITGNQYNMSVTGNVSINGNKITKGGYLIAAFGPGGETDCRAANMAETDGSYYLTVRGNIDGETITFKLYDCYNNEVITLSQNMFFDIDGIVPLDLTISDIDVDGDGILPPADCNDNDANVFPGNTEVCDGKDNDCDGQIDEGLLTTFYQDTDEDNFGDPNSSIEACSQPSGYVGNDDDCDDTNQLNYPDADEYCDGEDNDCDGQIDEGLLITYYKDADGDGFGDPDPNNSIEACPESMPQGYVLNSEDCDDTDADVVTPNADFTSSTTFGFAPLAVHFEAAFNGNGNYTWKFGDKTPLSNEKDPNHTFINGGDYLVTLTVDINGRCLTKKTKKISVLGANNLTGKVSNKDDNSAVEGAKVSVVAYPNIKATTNPGGEFELKNLKLGSHTLMISAPGYETKFEAIVNKPGANVVISLNQNVGWICGKILDQQPGQPAKKATLIAFTYDDGFYAKEAQVDPNEGTYIVYLGKSGNYTLLAGAPGHNPYLGSNQGAGYPIDLTDPNTSYIGDPNTFNQGVDINLVAKSEGPKIKVSSFERDIDPDPNTIDNETVIRVTVVTDAPLPGDPNVTITKEDQTELLAYEVVIEGKTLYEAIYNYDDPNVHEVKIQISAMDQYGVSKTAYTFTVHPDEKPTIIEGMSDSFIPADGVQTDELGGVDLNGDGTDDENDTSFVYIPPFGIAADPNTAGEDPNFAVRGLSIRLERLAGQDEEAITSEYNIDVVDKDGNKLENFIVNEEHPITIYLHFNPLKFMRSMANLVIKYKGADGLWKTDGISNVRIDLEKNAIVFDVIHLTTFAAFEENIAPSNLLAKVKPEASNIELTWQDNSSNEHSFEIMRCVADGLHDPNEVADYDSIAMVDPNIEYYLDQNCSVGNTYYYMVSAVNEFGSTEYSNLPGTIGATITVCNFPPADPSGLTATVLSHDAIQLNWADNSDCEGNFSVERSTDGVNFVEIATPVPAEWLDTNLEPETTYYYRVKAVSNDDNISDSGWSNVVDATTLVKQVEPKPDDDDDDDGGTCFISVIRQKHPSWLEALKKLLPSLQ